MGIIKITSRMSYYDYYGGYGNETTEPEAAPAVDEYYEEPATEMADDGEAKNPMVMAYMLVPILDGVSWYVTNDKWSASNISNWDNAAMSMLAGAGFKAAVTVATMAMMDAMHMVFYYTAAVSAVWELANIYLVNKANGTNASDSQSTNIAYGLSAASAALSVAGFMGMMGMEKDDEEVADEYYEEEPTDATGDEGTDEGTDNGYGGYGGYSGYGYYY